MVCLLKVQGYYLVWADDIMKDIDLIKAYHLFLFLCVDIDSTVSSLAKKRLDIATTQEGNITCSTVDGSPSINLPDFKCHYYNIPQGTIENHF